MFMDDSASENAVGTKTERELTESGDAGVDEAALTPPAVSRDAMEDHIRGAIEALLFVNERPITLEQFKRVLKTVGVPEIRKAIDGLRRGYEDRLSGIQVVEIAGGYQMLTNKTYAVYVRDFYKTRHKEKLSKPALETLAIMAYKQPVTRSEVEVIRGVNSDGVVNHLLGKELIKIVGRKDVPGKPYLYGTTKQFLEYFGLKSLDGLPRLEEFPQLQPDYEKTELDSEYLAEGEPSIPEDSIVMGSLEETKQAAIRNHRMTVKNDVSDKDGQDGGAPTSEDGSR
jgi:segregation and condensation protein B